jgi:uncharacterized protein
VPLFRRSASRRKSQFRVFFATDVHGSDRCFRKFLAAASAYEADVLILGGDIAGKAIVPIVDRENGLFDVHGGSEDRTVKEAELVGLSRKLQDSGLYPIVMDAAEIGRLEDPAHRDRVFQNAILSQVDDWCGLAAERLDDSVRCIITPGNDDPWSVDPVLNDADRVECPERELLDLGPVILASLGNANRTPWDTEREFDEDELGNQIDEMLTAIEGSARLVVNFHVPPYGSGLDKAIKLDQDFRPVVVAGRPIEIPVGSTAVLDAIDRYSPVVGLHGHIHESPGSWKHNGTMCLNPGSDYGSGVLKGALILFSAGGEYVDHLLTTG